MIFAHPVSRKCAARDVMQLIMHHLKVVGHRELVFKTGQEPATSLIQEEVAGRRPRIMRENIPVGESPANRAGEIAAQKVTRIMKDALERRVGGKTARPPHCSARGQHVEPARRGGSRQCCNAARSSE